MPALRLPQAKCARNWPSSWLRQILQINSDTCFFNQYFFEVSIELSFLDFIDFIFKINK